MILAKWTGKLPTRTRDDDLSSTNSDGDEDKDLVDVDEYDVAKEGVSYDGEMFLSAAVRVAAKMHLEMDVQLALVRRQEMDGKDRAKEKEQGSENAAPSPAKIAETLDRARVMFTMSVMDAL